MEHSDLLVLLAIEKLAGFNLTQDQLGELCGLSRDTFTGTLVRLKKKGLIESSSGHIRCLKKNGFDDFSGMFQPGFPLFQTSFRILSVDGTARKRRAFQAVRRNPLRWKHVEVRHIFQLRR